MNLFKTVLSYLILFFLFSFAEAGDIKGKVKYDGKPPKKKPLRMDADPVCGSSHSGKVFAESFKVNGKGELAECLVYLKNVSYKGEVPKHSCSAGSERLHLYTSRFWNSGRSGFISQK